MENGKVFFVSPIGKDDSPERKQSDFLYKYVLLHCCKKFDLQLIRADEICGDTDINSDIINLLEVAEVCIVDLTGLNANVMFELGVRYKSNLPIIILARKDTTLPFDIISKRTIFFDDIGKTEHANELIVKISSHLEKFQEENYRKGAVMPTLSEIYKMLEIINKKINTPISSIENNNFDMIFGDESVEQILKNLEPVEAFHFAYKSNQIHLAEQLLEYVKTQPNYKNKLCALATKGSQKAIMELENILPSLLEENDIDEIIEVAGSLVSGYNRLDIEKDKIELIDDIFDKVLSDDISNKKKALVLNQKQRLYAGAGDFNKALMLCEQIIQLDDEEPAFYFNYATIYKYVRDMENAKKYIKKCVDLSMDGEPHEEGLALACELYADSEDLTEQEFYNKCLSKLTELNPYRARFVKLL